MPAYTFYHDSDLKPHERLTLDPDESHHLARVMRLSIGDTCELINGRGILAKASILHIGKSCELEIQEILHSQVRAEFTLEIIQGLPSLNKADWIVEKLTELGVDQITFFGGEHSSRHELSDHQMNKLHAKCLAACKQSGRLFVPSLRWMPTLESFQPDMAAGKKLFMLDPEGDVTNFASLNTSNIIAFIGPESGFSKSEKQHLCSLGAKPLCIHKNILRTETASVGAAMLLSHYQNRLT